MMPSSVTCGKLAPPSLPMEHASQTVACTGDDALWEAVEVSTRRDARSGQQPLVMVLASCRPGRTAPMRSECV